MSDRTEALKAARRILGGKPLFLDTETTGFGYEDEIVEIAILDTAGETLFHERLKPAIPIPGEASAYHGITGADVAMCPTISDAWPALKKILAGRTVCCYNADYDRRMLRQSLLAHHILPGDIDGLLFPDVIMPERKPDDIPPLTFGCVMELFAAYYGEWNDYHGNYKFKKLAFAAEFLGIPSWKEHGALADAEATRQVLVAMTERADDRW